MDDELARLMENTVSEAFGEPDRTPRNVAMFAGYTIVQLLGSGGMGEVYLAQHPRLPRLEALKILSNAVSHDADYRRRFLREADLAAALWHPNIVRINDRGEFNGQLWISMDFIDGTDAASLLRNRYPVGMPTDLVARIVETIACALDYAHQHHDLLHRDVSPANILVTKPADGEQRTLLGDFGIARNIGDASGLTATNTTIGTFPYAAPEQLTGEPVDGRADQYALAATAYHLLTGTTLFPHTNPAVVISHHLTAPPPALAKTRPKLAAFDPVLAVALAKDPADRFDRCTDFARAFAEAGLRRTTTASATTVQAPVAVRPPERTVVPSAVADDKQQRRTRWRARLAAASTVIAVTAVGSMLENDNTASKQRPSTASPAPASVQAASAPQPPASQPLAPAPPAPAPQGVPPSPAASPTPATVHATPEDAPPAPAPKRAPAPRAASQSPASVQAAAQDAPPAVAPQRPAPSPDEDYLNRLSQIPGLRVADPALATASARAVCGGLQNGESPADAAAVTSKNGGMTPAQATAGVNAAITAYCPEVRR